jgi:putative transposase
MPRIARVAPGGLIYHVYNHGFGGMKIFRKPADYQTFVNLLAEAQQHQPIRVYGFVVMPTHWHLVLGPRKDGDLSNFMRWLTNTHVRRYQQAHNQTPSGHVYQGRFRSFPIQNDRPLLDVLKYVEANPARLGLVKQAQAWEWSSLAIRQAGDPEEMLAEWPVKRPPNWLQQIGREQDEKELAAIRTSVVRGRPYGTDQWVMRTVDRLGLETTVRPRGRPRKAPVAAGKTTRKK